jgi:uncharacterized protein
MSSVADTVARAPRVAVAGLIRAYQLTISPLTGPRCKFYPTCSHYGLEAVRVHGAFVGGAMAAWRVLRCNPWSVGGVDDVPALGEQRFRLHRNNVTVTPTASIGGLAPAPTPEGDLRT